MGACITFYLFFLVRLPFRAGAQIVSFLWHIGYLGGDGMWYVILLQAAPILKS